jgi:hypothetical protein
MTAIPFRRRKDGSVETLLRRISVLVAERQDLRSVQDCDAALERNRVEIARCQRELNHALIELYSPKHKAA